MKQREKIQFESIVFFQWLSYKVIESLLLCEKFGATTV